MEHQTKRFRPKDHDSVRGEPVEPPPKAGELAFYLYILRCRDGSYYTGHTDDLETRIAEHQAGTIPGYTAERLPVELVFVDEFPTRYEALERERQIKGWSRAKKEALIGGDWDAIQRLARSKPGSGPGPSTSSGRTD